MSRDEMRQAAAAGLLALTVQNPWAYSIVAGGKDVENRVWKPTIPGPFRLAIHAGKTYAHARYLNQPSAQLCADLFNGRLLGFATFTGAHHADECRCECSSWAQEGQWHWELRHAHCVAGAARFPMRGRLGLWTLPADIWDLVDTASEVVAR